MNSLERVTAAVRFEPADRVPVIAQVFGHAARVGGVALGDYLRDGELLARCQLRALEGYGYDAVFALMDVNVETEAMGSVLRYAGDAYPTIETYVVPQGADPLTPGLLAVPDPERDGRMPELLAAAAALRREVADEVLVVGCVLGPMTLLTQLMGAERALYFAIDAPERFAEVLDLTLEVGIRFGVAQVAAGVHLPVVFEPSASPAVVPPAFFRELLQPRLARLFDALKAAGAAASWLHIAGPSAPILPMYPSAGVDIANVDYYVSPAEVESALPRTCVDGTIRTVAFVEDEPADIAAEAARLLDAFAPRGGFILSSGCELPLESRPENIAALVGAARGR